MSFLFQAAQNPVMPTFLHFLRYWSLLASLASVFSLYFILIGDTVEEHLNGDQSRIGIKKIVAYSLMKHIEMDYEEYSCKESYEMYNEKRLHIGPEEKENVKFGSEQESWTHVRSTNLYISTVNLDLRLDPYHYIRIIGVVKGNHF